MQDCVEACGALPSTTIPFLLKSGTTKRKWCQYFLCVVDNKRVLVSRLNRYSSIFQWALQQNKPIVVQSCPIENILLSNDRWHNYLQLAQSLHPKAYLRRPHCPVYYSLFIVHLLSKGYIVRLDWYHNKYQSSLLPPIFYRVQCIESGGWMW